ncbi:MAG TPA: LPS export ABC transporter periplasmic protein LptC [Saprospiraceae bacterium]|nr:LPS export ABC transporter periplasmic protein LptC [Saprospiraceae bacterium]
MNIKKHTLSILYHKYLLFFTALLLAALQACNDSAKETRQVFTQDDTAVEVGKAVEILYSDSALVRVRVTGPVLHNYVTRDNPRQEFPEGIKIEFLEADLSVKSVLTAKNAIRQQEKGRITARDSVVMTTVKQEKLETAELIWDEKTAKVYTDKFVKVTKPGEVIYGFGLEAEQDFSYWKIIVPKGRIKVEQLDEVLE